MRPASAALGTGARRMALQRSPDDKRRSMPVTTALTSVGRSGKMRPMPGATEGMQVRLSRELIVDAYLRVVEEEGAEAATLRRLGAELGVDPTAVYRHVRDKEEILAAASDRLLAQAAEGYEPTGSWRADLRALALRARGAYLNHPHALLALETSPAALPNGFRLADLVIGCLREAGLPEDEVAPAFEVIEGYVIGTAIVDARASEETREEWRRAYTSLPRDRYPNLSAAASQVYRDPDAAFLYGLDLMLDALEARAAGRSRASRARPRDQV